MDRLRNIAAMLNGQVRNASRRVENAWRDDRLCRTGFQAQRTRATLIERGDIGIEWQTADDLGEEHPGTQLGVNHAAVLADPPDARVLCIDALLDRTGVDVRTRLERLAMYFVHPGHEGVEPGREHVVVVVAPRVAGDVGTVSIPARDRILAVGVVNRAG